MPSKSTLEALPMPNNDDVKLRVIPKKKFTTLAFSGSMLGEKSVAMKK